MPPTMPPPGATGPGAGGPPMPPAMPGAGGPPMPPVGGPTPPMPMPPAPNSIGATPPVPGVSAPMTPEHKAELNQLLGVLKNEYMKWKSMSFGIQNQANEARRDQLKKVFQMLQAKGVNLNDQKSVAAFLAQLKQNAPQHFDAITRALDYLLGSNNETQTNMGGAGLGATPQ